MLVGSIPVKVVNWLYELEVDLSEEAHIEFDDTVLTVSFAPDAGRIELTTTDFVDELGPGHYTIEWIGDLDNIQSVSISDEELVEAHLALDEFKALESVTYDLLTQLQEQYETHEYNLQTRTAAMVRQRNG